MLLRNYYKVLAEYSFSTPRAETNLVALDGGAMTLSGVYCDFFNTGTMHPHIGRVNLGALDMNKTGIILGSGTTPATFDDYGLENRIVADLSASVYVTRVTDENGFQISALITITNTTSEVVTIAECGLHSGGSTNSTTNRKESSYVLLDRTVLGSPITIEPGGVGQVTYTIRMNYPTA